LISSPRMALSIAKSAASIAKRPHRGTCIRHVARGDRLAKSRRNTYQLSAPGDLLVARRSPCNLRFRHQGTFFRGFHAPEAPQLPEVVELARRQFGSGGFFYRPQAGPSALSANGLHRATGLFTPRQGRTSLFFNQAQRRMQWLWLGWWRRGEDNSGFEQKFAYLLPYKIAHPGGGDIPCEQLDRMRPRPFSLLVGALTAGPTAEGWRPAAGADLEPLFADRAARSFAPPPFWLSGCHPEGPFDGFRQTLRQ
jgi:hypothetical protein